MVSTEFSQTKCRTLPLFPSSISLTALICRGLGKTIQIISLIAHLRHHNTTGPYLIAGPLATISNWVREFQKWLPSCPVVLYHGSKQEREEIRKKKMPIHLQKAMDFPVVVTSFDLCIIDRPHLEKYVWQYIILDEGHRIKNRNCKLLKDLKSFQSISRLLLTGTPIQNSLEELWSLLNFCSPMIFDDLEVFKSWFDFRNIGQDTKIEDILGEEQRDRIVTKLHEILRPFVLRRFKRETIGQLVSGKREIVIYCGMSSLQSDYYRRVLDGTLRDTLVDSGLAHAKKISQLNVLMNLRKVCNHPFLFGDITDDQGRSIRESDPDLFVAASGKFKLLDRMLPRLYAQGHKVIIFSQMVEVLNLLEDFLDYREYKSVRLDGSTKLADRQQAIDDFNGDPQIFVFLISTRAGGLGINLTAADTVILFDSDWNPHVDSQAQDRCHRIGQQNDVVVYRLLTVGSVEIDIMKKQISKKKLERLTIHGGDFRKAGKRQSSSVSLDDLRRLLEDDVKGIERKESHPAAQKEISEKELDLVLDRFQMFSEVQQALSHAHDQPQQPGASFSTPSKSPGSRPSSARRRKSEAETGSQQSEVSSAFPWEGEMYDFVNMGMEDVLSNLG